MKVAALPHPTLAASAPHSGLALQRGFGIIPEIPTYAVFLIICQALFLGHLGHFVYQLSQHLYKMGSFILILQTREQVQGG